MRVLIKLKKKNLLLLVVRYGREEMLALYKSPPQPPDELIAFSTLCSEPALHPLAFSPLSEEEQVIMCLGVDKPISES